MEKYKQVHCTPFMLLHFFNTGKKKKKKKEKKKEKRKEAKNLTNNDKK